MILVRLLLSVLSVWLTVVVGKALGIAIDWNGFVPAVLFVIVLSVVNAVIRPIANLIALPITCLTFGLFAFVITALLFWAVAAATNWITVDGFVAALFGSIMYGILSGLITGIVKNDERD